MRQLIGVLLFLICGALVNAKAPVQFIKDKIKSDTRIQNEALNLALQQRCMKYFRRIDNNPLSTILECRQEVHSFLRVLDTRVVQLVDPQGSQKSAPITVAYHTQLLKLMNQVSTHYALIELETALQLSGAQSFRLYQTLFRFFKNDQKVIQFLAVLFQDTTQGQAPIHYLKNLELKKSPIFNQNLDLLQKVHNQFFELQRTKKWKKDYQLYPFSVEQSKLSQSPTQYHFYVISHAVIQMAFEKRAKSADKIVFVATAFNYLYERFYHFSLNSAFSDQVSLSKKSSEDVNLGFLASIYGIGIHPESLINLPEIRQNPQEFFRTSLIQLKTYFP